MCEDAPCCGCCGYTAMARENEFWTEWILDRDDDY
jgi:hypothetical protein